jgi:hypothetical protein
MDGVSHFDNGRRLHVAREVGARVIGTGRSSDRDQAFAFGVDTFRTPPWCAAVARFTIAMPPKVQLVTRPRDGRLKPVVGAVWPLAEAPAALAPGKRTPGKTIIRVTEN